MHPCKVCKSMVFSLCPELCCHPKQVVFNRFKNLCVFRKMLTQLLVPSLTHVFQANDFTQHLIDELLISEGPGLSGVPFCKRVILNLHQLIRDSKVSSPESLFSVMRVALQPDACKAED